MNKYYPENRQLIQRNRKWTDSYLERKDGGKGHKQLQGYFCGDNCNHYHDCKDDFTDQVLIKFYTLKISCCKSIIPQKNIRNSSRNLHHEETMSIIKFKIMFGIIQ